MTTIHIASGLRERSKKEELAYDHSGHFQEYVFGHKLAKCHWEVHELMMEGRRDPQGPYNPALVLMPRDFAKTTMAEAFCLYRIGHNPLELTQFICSIVTKAEQRLAKIGSCIQHNTRYKQMFGELYPDSLDYTWKHDALEVIRDKGRVWSEGGAERDPTVAAFGVETSVEGGRATLQVYDDIVTVTNSRSLVQRTTVREKFWMSFDPMLLPEGQQLIFGTRYHYEDIYSEFIPLFDTDRFYTDLYVREE